MDIFFTDPTEIPLPPDEVRIRKFTVEPWPDGRRMSVFLEVDPSQKRPNANLVITNQEGHPVATASIIESLERKMEVTMHLRSDQRSGLYTASATLFFAEINEEPDLDQENPPIKRLVVDSAQTTFEIPE